MNSTAIDGLREDVAEMPGRLLEISNEYASCPYREGGWSRKELIGHLLDSCVNNHYRITRAVLEGGYRGDAYAQEGWVQVHRYQLLTWWELVSMWTSHNQLLLHLLNQVPDEMSGVSCSGGEEHCTLAGRVEDYASHLRHHLGQILS